MNNKAPAYYRARKRAIEAALEYELSLPESREGQMRIAYLRNGHEPDKFLINPDRGNNFNISDYSFMVNESWLTIKEYIYNFIYKNQPPNDITNGPLTQLELHTYDTFFQSHPEKVCGKQAGGSGFSFPVKTIGSKEDIMNAIDATLNEAAVKSGSKQVSDRSARNLALEIHSLNDLADNEIVFWNTTPLIYSKLSKSFFTANERRTPIGKVSLKVLRKAYEADQENVNKAIEKSYRDFRTHPQYSSNTVPEIQAKPNLKLFAYKAKAISIKLKMQA